LANHNHIKTTDFGAAKNKNSGLLQKSGPRVGLGKQRGAAICQKIKKDRRYRYMFAFSKTTPPQNLFFLFLFNFFLFFTIATLLFSNGRREKLLSVKSGRFGKVGVASLRGPHG
jgi:hypothetical protein